MRAKDFALEAKPLAPLEVPTPAQSTVEKSVKMANHIDKVLDQYELKKSIIQQEIDRLKDQIEALKYGPPEGSTVIQKGRGWVGRDREGHPIGGGPVDEAFDRPYKLKWEKGESGEDYDALVRLPDGSNLSIMFNEEGPGQYMVEFWRGAEQSVTGEGDAQRIFATVLAAIAKFIQQHQPQSIVFSAHKEDDPEQKSDSRSKLYNRLVQRYAGTMGYNYQSWDSGDSVHYELTRLKPGVAEDSLNEFLDDRDGDDGEGISQIVTITDRLLKQGYRVDLAVIGAMGRVYRADLDQTGFTPNGALAIKRKTRTFLRPFAIDDDDLYEFELVAPKHYKIVDSFTRSDDQGMAENFADGKVKGKSRPGRVKRAGASCNGSVTDLRQRAKNASGERAKMYHWCANMKSGRQDEGVLTELDLGFQQIGNNTFKITQHALDRLDVRKIPFSTVNEILRRISLIQDDIHRIGPGQKFWVHDPSLGISVGLQLLDSGRMVFTTAITGEPRNRESSVPVIDIP